MHDCGHDHHHEADSKRLFAALAIITVFLVVEVIGGIISGSLALLADAGHMLTDAFALALALSAQWISTRPADPKLHFGYRRAQVLAAFVNGVVLIGLLLLILVEAFHRFSQPVDVLWRPMLVVAILGLLANGVAYMILHRGESRNINVRGAMLHVASDFLGSVVAVIAAIVIATTGWTRIDPILSVLVALLIGRAAINLLRETGHILLEGAPSNIKVSDVVAELSGNVAGVEDVHSVQIWQITPEHPRLTLHALVDGEQDPQATLLEIKQRLEARFGIADSTIQIEFGSGCPGCPDATAQPAKNLEHDHGHKHAHDHEHSHGAGRSHRHGPEKPNHAKSPEPITDGGTLSSVILAKPGE